MSTRRDFLRATGACALALGAPTAVATPPGTPPPLPEPAMPATAHDPRHDFDFFHGRWSVENRRLRQRHAGADAWEEFPATLDCRPLLGGLGNLDEYRSHDVHGLSLRLFDPATRQWSDRWASAGDGQLGAPALGGFAGGVGTFVGRDTHAGQPVLTRMLWRDITPDGFTWEQAGSLDEGASWETNWIMRIRRVG